MNQQHTHTHVKKKIKIRRGETGGNATWTFNKNTSGLQFLPELQDLAPGCYQLYHYKWTTFYFLTRYF